MNPRLSTACVLLQLMLAQSARIAINADVSAQANNTQEVEAHLSPEAFQHQIDTFVKPMYHSFPKDECPFFAEGTVVLYCMARDIYQEKLQKAAPGDIDYGHFCEGDGQEYIRKLAKYVPAPEGGKIKDNVGMIKVVDKEFMSKEEGKFIVNPLDKINLDIHQHPVERGPRAPKRHAKYCLCDNECSDVPLAPLDDLQRLYEKHLRANKNDNEKIKFIKKLMDDNQGSVCGPCTAVPLDGRKGPPKRVTTPAKPSNPLQDKLATVNANLKRARERKVKAEQALNKARQDYGDSIDEEANAELKVKEIQEAISKA